MQMRKFVNFRPCLIIAIAMIFSIVFAVFVCNCNFALLLILFISFLVSAVIALAIYFVKKINICAFLSALFLFMALPFLSMSIKSVDVNRNNKYQIDEEIMLLGKVCDHYKISKNGYLQLIVDDVELLIDGAVESLNGKVVIYANPEYFDLDKIEIGKYIYAEMSLKFETINTKDRWSLSNLSKDIVATGFADYFKVKIYDEKDSTIVDEIKLKVFETLKSSNMKNAELGYAMIFGDSNIVDRDVKTIFQSTGIAHLLAVSGLHVSAIVFAISFLLKKLRLSQKSQLIILVVLLFFYCCMCNFSISVVRSSLMAVALNYSYVRGKAYDRLSVLSLVAIFLLLINPLQVFNISFVLSFSAVLSIILLSRPLSALFENVFYRKFANTLGVLFAIQIGLFAVNLFYFNSLQPLSFLANLVSIPLATFAFILLLILTVISVAFPFINFAFIWIGDVFEIITKYNSFIHGLNISIHVPSISVMVIPFMFALMFILSDYFFANKRVKLIASSILGIACALLFFI